MHPGTFAEIMPDKPAVVMHWQPRYSRCIALVGRGGDDRSGRRHRCRRGSTRPRPPTRVARRSCAGDPRPQGRVGEGRLTRDELDARVGQASIARTYAELGTLTADLPAGRAAMWPPREAAEAQTRPAAQTGAGVIVFATSVLTVLLLVRPMSAR